MRIQELETREICGKRAVYSLLVEEGSCGVQITLGEETATIPDLTPAEDRARELLKKWMDCGVTPVTLRDIVEDWLLL